MNITSTTTTVNTHMYIYEEGKREKRRKRSEMISSRGMERKESDNYDITRDDIMSRDNKEKTK